ncbi:hypothetical protein QUF90_05265 [Desulfococcaceae bacterium HSG9]|nr:hypothetical protein [Desulfococcaceae bacterium HSG9]
MRLIQISEHSVKMSKCVIWIGLSAAMCIAPVALRAEEELLRRENLLLRTSMMERYRFGDIIGKSKPMKNIYKTILKGATTDASIILYGERLS